MVIAEQLKWHGHVQRMGEDRFQNTFWDGILWGGGGRQTKSYLDVICGMMGEMGLKEEYWGERGRGRERERERENKRLATEDNGTNLSKERCENIVWAVINKL